MSGDPHPCGMVPIHTGRMWPSKNMAYMRMSRHTNTYWNRYQFGIRMCNGTFVCLWERSQNGSVVWFARLGQRSQDVRHTKIHTEIAIIRQRNKMLELYSSVRAAVLVCQSGLAEFELFLPLAIVRFVLSRVKLLYTCTLISTRPCSVQPSSKPEQYQL